MKARLLHVLKLSTGPIRVANTCGWDETSEQINRFWSNSKLTKEASQAQWKSFETLLACVEAFGRWVPLYTVRRKSPNYGGNQPRFYVVWLVHRKWVQCLYSGLMILTSVAKAVFTACRCLACVAWRFFWEHYWAAKPQKRGQSEREREAKPRGPNLLAVSLPSPAFIYFAHPTKTAMLRRLTGARGRHSLHSNVNTPFFKYPWSWKCFNGGCIDNYRGPAEGWHRS